MAQTPTTGPEVGAHIPAQAAADLIREEAKTDAAFLAAALIKDDYDKSNLASLLQYPTDEIVIVSLTGAQVKTALERSVSLLPQPNTSFLQLSGFEVTYKKSALPGERITGVKFDNSPIDPAKSYTIAMPSSLGRGGLGYFKIWDKSKISKTLTKTVEDVLKGKPFVESSPRWLAS